MDPRAIEKAELRFGRACESLQELERSTDFKSFSRAWGDFLHHLHGIYTPLEQGAKVNPNSRQWYGELKAKARKDPLLRYLTQARNSDEHGIEPIAEHRDGGYSIGGPGESVRIENAVVGASGFVGTILPVNGKLPTIRTWGAHPILITVYDERHGDRFAPPSEHLGKRLSDNAPVTVARLAIEFYEAAISEAKRRASP